MIKSLYWNVYRNLEKELLNLAEYILIDDRQLDIYSMKIADLIIRCAVETEAISKELYFREGGTEPNDNDLYYDTICLAYLNDKWQLDKKVVMVSSPEFYLEGEDNLVLKPLYKANKRGTSSSKWQRAYQALKHNRSESLKKHATLRNLISALAALYILNLYYKDQTYIVGDNQKATSLDTSFGSSIFSVKVHQCGGIPNDGSYKKGEDYDNCVYLIKATDKTFSSAVDAMNKFIDRTTPTNNVRARIIKDALKIQDLQKRNKTISDEINKQLVANYRKEQSELYKVLMKLRYEAELNKQQY